MNILYMRYIEFRIKKMNVERASLYVAKTKLSKAQKMQLLMDKGLTKAEAEAAILTALSSLGGSESVNE